MEKVFQNIRLNILTPSCEMLVRSGIWFFVPGNL